MITRQGYRYIEYPQHPNATSRGYILEHRLLMECILGRFLDRDEFVHHFDGNKLNNSPGNLGIMDKREHARYHGNLREKPLDIYEKEIMEMYKDGLGAHVIAKKLGTNKASILRYLHYKSVNMHPQRVRKKSFPGMKWCNTCESHLPLSEFYKSKTTRDGYRNRCIECTRLEAKARGDRIRLFGRRNVPEQS